MKKWYKEQGRKWPPDHGGGWAETRDAIQRGEYVNEHIAEDQAWRKQCQEERAVAESLKKDKDQHNSMWLSWVMSKRQRSVLFMSITTSIKSGDREFYWVNFWFGCVVLLTIF